MNPSGTSPVGTNATPSTRAAVVGNGAARQSTGAPSLANDESTTAPPLEAVVEPDDAAGEGEKNAADGAEVLPGNGNGAGVEGGALLADAKAPDSRFDSAALNLASVLSGVAAKSNDESTTAPSSLTELGGELTEKAANVLESAKAEVAKHKKEKEEMQLAIESLKEAARQRAQAVERLADRRVQAAERRALAAEQQKAEAERRAEQRQATINEQRTRILALLGVVRTATQRKEAAERRALAAEESEARTRASFRSFLDSFRPCVNAYKKRGQTVMPSKRTG